MAKDKVTITLDRAKAARAVSLVGASSTSEVIDRALDLLVGAENLRRDIAAQQKFPPTPTEVVLALLGDPSALDDETDWQALYSSDGAG